MTKKKPKKKHEQKVFFAFTSNETSFTKNLLINKNLPRRPAGPLKNIAITQDYIMFHQPISSHFS